VHDYQSEIINGFDRRVARGVQIVIASALVASPRLGSASWCWFTPAKKLVRAVGRNLGCERSRRSEFAF
jgi:hypothetical protein